MHQKFTCAACQQPSDLERIHQADGKVFALCTECGAKNELEKVPTPIGDPAQFKVKGVLPS